jgi:hypothetical protein
MKKTGIVTGIILLFLFSVSVQSADQCKGDLDCNGVVDGSDLALFATNYGRTDCPGGPSVVVGWVNFEESVVVDYYEMSLSLSVNPQIREVRLALEEGGRLFTEINMKAATGDTFSDIGVFFAGEELMTLQTVLVKSVKYIPPVRSGDIYLVEVAFAFSSISFGPSYGDCNEFNFLQAMGYAGPRPLPDYIPVLNYSFDMSYGDSNPDFQSIRVESDLDAHIGCYYQRLSTGSHIEEVAIEKWGPARDDGPESQIKLGGPGGGFAMIDGVWLYSSPSGGIEQRISLNYSKITWVHGELVDENWQEYETCWNVAMEAPC